LEGFAAGSATPFAVRELSPCVVERGVVYVAAADQPALFALEAATGQLLWANDNPALRDSEHLLGCVDGQLVAGGQRLAWIEAATGKLLCRFPAESDADGPRGFGRGLIAGDEILWPTRDRLLAFRTAPSWDGSRWRPHASRHFDLRIRGASGGNLALADGMLFIAGTDKLYAFGP
jgi:outer membrane protein assembly factor BamB